MKVEIISDEKNPLLGRREAEFQLVESVTPSRHELKAELAKVLKAKEELIVIDVVDQKTGSNLTTGRVKIYETGDIKQKVDLDYKDKRGVKEKKEEAAPAEVPTEEPKEETPKEEEKPAEEKSAEEATRGSQSEPAHSSTESGVRESE